jgi:hypothetical protein
MSIGNRLLLFLGLMLALFLATPAMARVSVNVPIGHWSYEAIGKLKALGLINSDIRGTRPWTDGDGKADCRG